MVLCADLTVYGAFLLYLMVFVGVYVFVANRGNKLEYHYYRASPRTYAVMVFARTTLITSLFFYMKYVISGHLAGCV
jgi:hypothetical protein